MGWMQKLCETYDNNSHMAGKIEEGKVPLSPISHMLANAQIEVTITEEGEFMRAIEVDKSKRSTFIPVTEASAGRASGIAPHPLSDTLSYVAGDFGEYLTKKKDIEKCEEKHEAYMTQLAEWVNSEFTHPKARAVYEYCLQEKLTSDLLAKGILSCDENGSLSTQKIQGNAYEKCIVRWRVLTEESGSNTACWEDKALIQSFIEYLNASNRYREKDICYVTGEETTYAVNHPKGILAANYGAKLISANDESGFTFRGRFYKATDANTVGYESTQKAHNVLRWLVANQGVNYGGRVFVCWNPKGKKVPSLQDESSIFGDVSEDEEICYTMPIYKKRLFKAINGWRNELDDCDDIVIIGLDAATTGRLSITYYNELMATDFLARIEHWWENCCWYYTAFDRDKKPYQEIKCPSIRSIVRYAFGTQQGEMIKADERVMKEHSQRLFHCIVDKNPFPRDILKAIVNRASTPQAYTYGNRERLLSTACAFICKGNSYKEEDRMVLDETRTDRSYLFGRLLAVAEKIERATYTSEESREPNAIRLQSNFQQHPMYTWRILYDSLNPYIQRLPKSDREYYKNLIGQIIGNLCEEDEKKLNLCLEDDYLLGYFLQRKELNKKNNKKEEAKLA